MEKFSNIFGSKHKPDVLDLTKLDYHGGTTFSSGALPKWDLEEGMIKRCSMDAYGNNLTDSLNEVLFYEFCTNLGVPCAYYEELFIKYKDIETGKIVECPAIYTKFFEGPLLHYRDLRIQSNLGKTNDELVEFIELFDVSKDFMNLLVLDYLFNQQDRHSKNFGLVNGKMSPIFDSGSSLFFDIPDNVLSGDLFNNVPRQKAFGKSYEDLIVFMYKDLSVEFKFTAKDLKNAVHSSRVIDRYERSRGLFIKQLIIHRIEKLFELFEWGVV